MKKYERKTKKAVYSGVLLSPISASPKLFRMIYGDELAEQERLRFVADSRQLRLKALAEHFGLNEVDVRTAVGKEQILWALAEAHVPGFKVETKHGDQRSRGRPSFWTSPQAQSIFAMVQAFAYGAKVSEREACRQVFETLKKGERATEGGKAIFKGMDFESFYSRYKEMKALGPWAEGGKEAFDVFKKANPHPV